MIDIDKRLTIALSCAVSALLNLSFCSASGLAAEKLTPSELYTKYRKALAAATTIDSLSPFLSKKVIAEVIGTPKEMKGAMFAMMKEMTPKAVQVVEEKVEGDHATLSLTVPQQDKQPAGKEKTTEKTTGFIQFVDEEGSWKIDKEKWDTKITTQ